MAEIENGRALIKEFMKKNNISEQDLASAYGKSRTWVQRVLNGNDDGPAVNLFILTIIRDYKLRGKKKQEV